jgi:hypothetical protein
LGNFSQAPESAGANGHREIYSSRMQDKIQKQILDAFFVVLRPIAKILLRYGIGYREFAEVAKSAFVDVASSEYGIRGRRTNMSRVAVMTGLTRKEVKRLRDKIDAGHHAIVAKTTPLATILHRWNSDQEFLDQNGRPATLPFSGGERSFSALVRKFGGDIPPGAMRTELKRIDAIEEDSDGNLTAVRRDVHPQVEHENLVMLLMHNAYALMSNIAHNSDPDRADEGWAQLIAYSQDVQPRGLPRLRRISQDRLKEVAMSFDDLIAGYEHENSHLPASDLPNDSSESNLVAVGMYYFEERGGDGISNW